MTKSSPLLTEGFVIIGHRGAAGRAPENTMSSFRHAWRSGVRAIELDVQNVEEELIVLHDDSLDRTTTGRGDISDFSLAELRSFDAGNSEPIPLLGEVLAAAPESTLVNIELKGRDTAALVAAEVTRWPQLVFMVSSFNLRELARFDDLQARSRQPTALAPLFHYWRMVLKRAERFRARGVSINIGNAIATERHVAQLTEAGWKVCVYTVNDAERAAQLRDWGVRAVFSDVPDALLHLET
ncbi:MAG: hypothetical protein NXH85_18535 [Pseudomonadaceae bacterium]|nr:hypothetical protein [Pseudomonadaceae bacterium]